MPNIPQQPFGPSKQSPSQGSSNSQGSKSTYQPSWSPSAPSGQSPIGQSTSSPGGLSAQSPPVQSAQSSTQSTQSAQSAKKSSMQRTASAKIDQLTSSDRTGHDGNGLRSRPTQSGDLVSQTPGLDAMRPVRDIGIRVASWVRERPVIAAGVVCGVVLCAFTPFIVRRFL